jgi:hypothetical protein
VEVSEGKAAQASEEEGQTTEAGRATVLSFLLALIAHSNDSSISLDIFKEYEPLPFV